MVWQKLGSETGAGSNDILQTDTYTAKETSQWFSHGECGTNANSNNAPTSFFNGNNTQNGYFSTRQNWHANATGSDTTSTDEYRVSDSSGNDDDFFKMGYLCDVSGEQKLFIAFSHSDHVNNGNSYASVGKIEAGIGTTITKYGQWDAYWSNDFESWTNVTIVGGDDTIPSTPIDDFGTHLAGTIFQETDTAKYKWYDGTSWLRDGSEHGATRGLFAGGYDTSDETATIEYITFATLGNATDFGDRTENRMKLGACADGTKACFAGGESANSDTIDYVTILTTGNATDFGNLTSARNGQGGCTTSTTRGLFSGGGSVTTTIDYITIATTGNATDFGDHAPAHGTCTVSDLTRALIHIHEGTSDYYNEDIEYVTIDTTGNSTDFGDIIEGKSGTGAVSNLTRAVIAGGKYTGGASNVRNSMDYVTIQTLGNGTDFGDLTSARSSLAGCSSTTKGVFGGGYNGSNFNTIDYITIDTVGNATDFGDLTTATRNLAGASDLY